MACRAEPIRTCIGCRSRAPSSDLLRIVVDGAELLPDARRRLRGRGAHLHPDQACLELAERRKAFPRALRVPGPLEAERIRRYLEQLGSGAVDPVTRVGRPERPSGSRLAEKSGKERGAPRGSGVSAGRARASAVAGIRPGTQAAPHDVDTEAGRDSDDRSMSTQP
ncbi:YlxR family protein [Frankia sp. AgPm24]|uniref:YlxR family protein n=1 Tax=Frankia sp. AgPm24 TaxID=631128 RepID=UPI00200C19A6|nr:YlxR family protein [Frankia sp. AgPm24]MCK9922427.1 YlxR family protein [Frankia sp. AgPm24]